MPTLRHRFTTLLRISSVRTILIVPFVIQIVVAVGVTGYLSFRNGQQAINDLVVQLESEVAARVDQRLDAYLVAPLQVISNNAEAPRLELIDVNNPATLGRYFWQQLHQFPSVEWVYFANERGGLVNVGHITGDEYRVGTTEGFGLGDLHQYATNSQGHRTQLLRTIPQIDWRQRGWYKSAVLADRPIWSEVYKGALVPESGISMAQSVRDQSGKLQGVMGIDLTFAQVSEFLQGLKIGRSGYVYIMEPSGFMVASSATEAPFTVDPQTQAEQRLLAENSRVPLINASARDMHARFGDLARIDGKQNFDFMLEGARHYAQVLPYKDEFGLDWLIVVVVPESDFMSQINANTRTTIALMVVALCVAIVVGTLTAQWVVQPILSLNTAAKAMATQDWARIAGEPVATPTLSRTDEVGQLARSFSSMASQLRASFATLEVRVLERTNELAERTQQLTARSLELIKAKDQAESANAAKSMFLATMNHELRTPLSIILGFAQLMARSRDLPPKQQEYLATIQHSGEHLLGLINSVLDLAKVEAGRATLNETTVDLAGLSNDLELLFRQQAAEKGLTLRVERAATVPRYVRADAQKLRQVLINFLANAVKFTEAGSVTLRVATDTPIDAAQSRRPPSTDRRILDQRPALPRAEHGVHQQDGNEYRAGDGDRVVVDLPEAHLGRPSSS